MEQQKKFDEETDGENEAYKQILNLLQTGI